MCCRFSKNLIRSMSSIGHFDSRPPGPTHGRQASQKVLSSHPCVVPIVRPAISRTDRCNSLSCWRPPFSPRVSRYRYPPSGVVLLKKSHPSLSSRWIGRRPPQISTARVIPPEKKSTPPAITPLSSPNMEEAIPKPPGSRTSQSFQTPVKTNFAPNGKRNSRMTIPSRY